MILEPYMIDPRVSWIHISDPICDNPWASIGNCHPGIWLARKTDLGLEVCHQDYLETNPREWVSSERDVGIDSEVLIVSYDYTPHWFRQETKTVGPEWCSNEYALIPISNGYYDVYMKYNKIDGKDRVTGIWVEGVIDEE